MQRYKILFINQLQNGHFWVTKSGKKARFRTGLVLSVLLFCVFRMCFFQRTRTIWFLPFPDNPVADSARAAVIVHSHLVDLEGWWKKHGWQQARTLKCKILLPKFNTWEQVHLERKKGSLPPFENAVGRFLAKNRCRYSVIASPLHRNGNAIAP